ncbi:formate dehydrogenase, alpha subunit [Thermincola potens JR]|uniref:Formate dehydrogenase, alpha subunit n=3 Tax=Thermincola TaxID=278993 RepID=D5XCL1_THEPJ|nr:formate dehydrogenase, alpha subunit [Thermincola potens JR]
MTNHWIDLKNTDLALIIGGNPAENHPMSFKWLTKAREERGARIIHVDPRFTRTSAKADIYAKLRSGTDIAFIGGIINYLLQNELYNKEYVLNYTNAATLVNPGYKFEDGLFSGYNAEKRKYKQETWDFQKDPDGKVLKDPTLKNPLCVLNIMKKHYERYDIDTVCRVTGTPKEVYRQVLEEVAKTAAKDKSMTIMYAMGTTQHTVGSQNVRSYAILQLLLGNIGIPGGGINAMRGESNVQGSTDFGLLFHIIPGYINTPKTTPDYVNLAAYLNKEVPKTSFWANKDKFFISYLKAMWGDAATPENEFAYHYLPKYDAARNYSHIALFEAMAKGDIKGLMAWGQNPVVAGPNANNEAKAMENLDWLCVVELWETETAAFWKRPGADPRNIKTEVFLLPACASYEKQGSISNSGRWIQWRWKGVDPVGEARADLDIIYQLGKRLKELYKDSTRPEDAPIRDLTWDYGQGEECDIEMVAREISGYTVADKKPVKNFTKLAADGSTACGCWVMSGMIDETGKNLAQRRDNKDDSPVGNYLNWAYAWPVNRRILYNRASADLTGKPWSQEKADIWWDPLAVDKATGAVGKWVGYDVPDFKVTCGPNAVDGVFDGKKPFIMRPDGLGGLFAAMNDGPLPEHYEPWDTPLEVNPFSGQKLNPVVKVWRPDEQGTPDKFPIVATTYRVSEHWQAGAMTRNIPWLAELFPEMYVEIGEDLAREKGIKNGDEVIVASARGEIKCYAMVTKRFQAFEIDGKTVHQVGLPWHFGFQGYATGEIANKLTPHIGDGNSMIPEYKAFLVNIRRAG